MTQMGKGQELYKKAKILIPGGTMLLSKRPEMFLPEHWPSYFSKSKGCKVWDLDGRELLDMSIMGIGTNTLGYGNDEVDAAVMETVKQGNMSTLNCPEEVYLAEKLVEMNPWADMVRFARTGGEANSIAIGIGAVAGSLTNTVLVLLMLAMVYGDKIVAMLSEVGIESSAIVWAVGVAMTNGVMEAIAATVLVVAIATVYLRANRN